MLSLSVSPRNCYQFLLYIFFKFFIMCIMVYDCYISSEQEVPFNINYSPLFYLLWILFFLCLVSLTFPDIHIFTSFLWFSTFLLALYVYLAGNFMKLDLKSPDWEEWNSFTRIAITDTCSYSNDAVHVYLSILFIKLSGSVFTHFSAFC